MIDRQSEVIGRFDSLDVFSGLASLKSSTDALASLCGIRLARPKIHSIRLIQFDRDLL